MSPWALMALPFLECLVLVGIHSYLGIHVIRRKVIFVDLALAQVAALGTIVAFLFGLAPSTPGAYVFSLLFTFVGAAVFSLTRLRREKVPQEAVIGLVYALAAAVSILVIDRAPHGAEHIKEILTGAILWVDGRTVLTAAIVYAAVGVFHYAFRDRFFLISSDPEEAFRRGISVRLWDFLFYTSFGLVITVSVHTAGVLLVFVFLVVPAILAIITTDRLLYQLLIGWGVGAAVSFVGLVLSYAFDFPSGPTVVSVYGAALLLAALGIYVSRSERRWIALGFVVLGAVATAAAVVTFYFVGALFRDLEAGRGEGGGPTEAVTAPRDRPLLESLSDVDITERPRLLAGETDAAALREAFGETDDEELRVSIAGRLLEIDPPSGMRMMLEIMETGELPLFRDEAFRAMSELSGDGFGFDPLDDPAGDANRAALSSWKRWLESSVRRRDN